MSGLLNSLRWNILPPHDAEEKALQNEFGVPPLVARILASRGITAKKDVAEFLHPNLDKQWLDPYLIPGMKEASERVYKALAEGETIAVFGDFDVDGMTSTCLLTLALRELGGQVYSFIPNRFEEGYGLSLEALHRVIDACHPDLIVTVDNGIASASEVAWLLDMGIDVVVTDHHEPSDLVPQGIPVCDPKLSSDCESRELAGAGVALKLVYMLGHKLGQPELWKEYIDIATLGTISDMMILEKENRALVFEGLKKLKTSNRPGIIALAEKANCDLSSITADGLPFSLIPRLNAAGRMGVNEVAFDLLMVQNLPAARGLAEELEEINQERRSIESELSDLVIKQVQSAYKGERVVMCAGEGWHEGVKGIVASRICNHFHVPSLMFSIEDGIAKGSGRSVGKVDLFQAVSACADDLVRFGGHAGAVGVTIKEENIQTFKKHLLEYLDKLDEKEFIDTQEVSGIITLEDITLESIASLEVLQPFGQGNKRPLFGIRNVLMTNKSAVGQSGEHLRFTADDGSIAIAAIMFRVPNIERALLCEEVVDLVVDPIVEEWQGRIATKLMVKDIIYHGDEQVLEFDDMHYLLKKAGKRIDTSEDVFSSYMCQIAVRDLSNAGQSVPSILEKGKEVQLVVNESTRDIDVVYQDQILGVLCGKSKDELYQLLLQQHELVAKLVSGKTIDQDNVLVEVIDATDSSDGAFVVSDYGEATELARKALIGEYDFLPAQRKALEFLEEGENTLCIMATGRGKSCIFHTHAVREALVNKKASVYVFPLRALVSDQSFHLQEKLRRLDIVSAVITGETSQEERECVFRALAQGDVQIVLTTPEFFVIHAQKFVDTHKVGFVVIDEAHHAGQSKLGIRELYQKLPETLELLGNPVVLGVTATAGNVIATEICRLLSVDSNHVIVDDTVRNNLHVVDKRFAFSREKTLICALEECKKAVVYVNSRELAMRLCRILRMSHPEFGHKIAFYHAGLMRSERRAVEKAFRDGEVCCIVATSAFGEGVDIPDIRQVFLYQTPLTDIDFNQMSGRAGRDGADADIYILCNKVDNTSNEMLLQLQMPDRQFLVNLYKVLKYLDGSKPSHEILVVDSELKQRLVKLVGRVVQNEEIEAGIAIFSDLGLLEVHGFGDKRYISMTENPCRMELKSSIRYSEGLHTREAYQEFSDWIVGASCDEILQRINRPITTSVGIHL